ncbi:MAG: vWA domain-containing protein [Gaiellaceae bacterium]
MSRRRLPLADAGSLAALGRRTRLHWTLFAVSLVSLTSAAVLLARTGGAGAGVLPNGGSTVVVVDLSGSTRAASKRIATALLGLTHASDRRLGLVVFSDTGYEALPLAAPVGALRAWLMLLADGTLKDYPWTPSFSGGTVISAGLSIARRMLLSRPPADRHVLLVSDLVDGVVDLPKLQSVVAQYQREQIDLRVISVKDTNGATQSNASFLQLPNAGFVTQAATRTIDSASLAPRRSSAAPLVGLVAVIALLAAAYELMLHPLTWRRT